MKNHPHWRQNLDKGRMSFSVSLKNLNLRSELRVSHSTKQKPATKPNLKSVQTEPKSNPFHATVDKCPSTGPGLDSPWDPQDANQGGDKQIGEALAPGGEAGVQMLPVPSEHSTKLSKKNKQVRTLVLFRLLQSGEHLRSDDLSVSAVVLSRCL